MPTQDKPENQPSTNNQNTQQQPTQQANKTEQTVAKATQAVVGTVNAVKSVQQTSKALAAAGEKLKAILPSEEKKKATEAVRTTIDLKRKLEKYLNADQTLSNEDRAKELKLTVLTPEEAAEEKKREDERKLEAAKEQLTTLASQVLPESVNNAAAGLFNWFSQTGQNIASKTANTLTSAGAANTVIEQTQQGMFNAFMQFMANQAAAQAQPTNNAAQAQPANNAVQAQPQQNSATSQPPKKLN